jgi:hypothetical protein
MTDGRAPRLLPPLPAAEKGLPSIAGEGWGGALLILASANSQSTPPNLPLHTGGGAKPAQSQSHD